MVESHRQAGLRAERAPAHDARGPPLGVLHHRYPARLRIAKHTIGGATATQGREECMPGFDHEQATPVLLAHHMP